MADIPTRGIRVLAGADQPNAATDPRIPLTLLYRNLRTSEEGLSNREAERRLLVLDPMS